MVDWLKEINSVIIGNLCGLSKRRLFDEWLKLKTAKNRKSLFESSSEEKSHPWARKHKNWTEKVQYDMVGLIFHLSEALN